MKIILNENEIYELEMPNEIKGNDFLNLIEKLLKLSKFIQISSYNTKSLSTIKHNPIKRNVYNNRRKYINTKEKVMDLLQYFYHGSRADKHRILNITKYLDVHKMSKGFKKLREKFNIQPNEIGFIKFPTIHDRRGIKIENWIIKSYTGMYDEKENSDEENGNN